MKGCWGSCKFHVRQTMCKDQERNQEFLELSLKSRPKNLCSRSPELTFVSACWQSEMRLLFTCGLVVDKQRLCFDFISGLFSSSPSFKNSNQSGLYQMSCFSGEYQQPSTSRVGGSHMPFSNNLSTMWYIIINKIIHIIVNKSLRLSAALLTSLNKPGGTKAVIQLIY